MAVLARYGTLKSLYDFRKDFPHDYHPPDWLPKASDVHCYEYWNVYKTYDALLDATFLGEYDRFSEAEKKVQYTKIRHENHQQRLTRLTNEQKEEKKRKKQRKAEAEWNRLTDETDLLSEGDKDSVGFNENKNEEIMWNALQNAIANAAG